MEGSKDGRKSREEGQKAVEEGRKEGKKAWVQVNEGRNERVEVKQERMAV
jgi:hypothetical protein